MGQTCIQVCYPTLKASMMILFSPVILPIGGICYIYCNYDRWFLKMKKKLN